jgi:hypothetical protein
MSSLFFKGEQNTRTSPEADVQPPPDLEAAVRAVSDKFDAHYITCFLHTSVADAAMFAAECRAVETGLLAEIRDNKITTQAAAIAYVEEHSRKDFPATVFLDMIKLNVGKDTKAATWAEVVTAVKATEKTG